MNITVVMKQVTPYQWQIMSPKGFIIQGDLMLHNAYKAEEYVKAYISSFTGWHYIMEPLCE